METKKQVTIPLGIRNNNPLNLVYSKNNNWHGQLKGQKGRFCAFEDMVWGFRAAAMTLKRYITKYNRKTIREIINAWAPPSENDTRNYAKFVADSSNVGIDEPICFSDIIVMLRIMSAMCVMENGRQFDPQNNSVLWKALYQGYRMAYENSTEHPKVI